MKYRKLDNGDYIMGHGQQDFLIDSAAVAQAIQTRLLLLKGEWWEDLNDGTPLFDILGQPGTDQNIRAADLIMQERIATTTGVSSIIDFKSNYSSRKYNINCICATKYGTLEVTV